MRDNRKYSDVAIDVIVLLVGVICILAQTAWPVAILAPLLQAIGTGLIGAAVVSMLVRRLYRTEQQPEVTVAALKRKSLGTEYRQKHRTTLRLEIMGIALGEGLEQYRKKSALLQAVLRGKAEVKLLFLSPSSPYLEQRAREDGVDPEDLRRRLNKAVNLAFKIGDKLSDLYSEAEKAGGLDPYGVGSFEIRLLQDCPYCTLYMTDDEIIWGLYASDRKGFDSAAFRVRRDEGGISAQLENHFDQLWKNSLEASLVVFFQNHPPEVRRELAATFRKAQPGHRLIG